MTRFRHRTHHEPLILVASIQLLQPLQRPHGVRSLIVECQGYQRARPLLRSREPDSWRWCSLIDWLHSPRP